MADIVVIGGGICGLATAILLSRDGHDVTVVDHDTSVPPDSPRDAWDHWARKGIGQFWQPHHFFPGFRALLEAEFPEIQEALPKVGGMRIDYLNPHPFTEMTRKAIDDKLWVYNARRPLAEWLFARAASEVSGLTLRRGFRVNSLRVGPSVVPGMPHINGVRSVDGEEIGAELVVDATGRASRSPEWLEALGARRPYEESADSGFTYYSRYFTGDEPERTGRTVMHYGTISVLTLPGDNQTWSVTVFMSSDDRALKPLRHPDKWAKTVRLCPMQAHWLDGEPITDVLAMSGVVDRYRRLVIEGSPVATGFVVVADAWACTNPTAARGVTVGLMHARLLRNTLRECLDDPLEFALRFDAATEREVSPWYRSQIVADRFRVAEMEALRQGHDRPRVNSDFRPIWELLATMGTDPELYRAGLEYICTLTPVHQIFERADIRERIAVALEAIGKSPPPTQPGPDRAQLLELMD